jgi:Cu-Zn family superoxide dismutase
LKVSGLSLESSGCNGSEEASMSKHLFALGTVGWLLAAPALAGEQPAAVSEIKDLSGQLVGTATFRQQPEGVLVNIQVQGLQPGKHAMHIHAVGKCEPPTFKSAGPHLGDAKMASASGMPHNHGAKGTTAASSMNHAHSAGPMASAIPHNHGAMHAAMAGDLPDLVVGSDGSGKAEILNAEVRLTPGRNFLLQSEGTALLIHDVADPNQRIACGVISKAPNSSPEAQVNP